MKIAIVCLSLQWQAGGTRLIYSLAHGLAAQGNKVVIYASVVNEQAFPDLRKGLDIRAVPTAFFEERTVLPPTLFLQILNRIGLDRKRTHAIHEIVRAMDDDFDVVNPHDIAYKVGFFYKKKNPKSVVIWTENDPPYTYTPKGRAIRDFMSRTYNQFKDFTQRKYLRAVDRVAVLDGYNERWCKARGLHPVVIRSGVDFDYFHAQVHDIKKGGPVRIIAVGALNLYRRFEDIIEAVAALRSEDREVSLLIVCKNIWSDDVYRDKLSKLVQTLGLQDSVQLKFDGLSNEDLKKAYAESDIYILTTYIPPPRAGYGWGLSNFEAMAAGLPIIICRTCTATEVLTDRENALLIDPESSKDVAQKIRVLMDDPALARKIAANGQELVRKTISWEIYAKNMVDLFSQK